MNDKAPIRADECQFNKSKRFFRVARIRDCVDTCRGDYKGARIVR